MLASLGDVLSRVAPEATAVAIVSIVLKLIRHAIDDDSRWKRLMTMVVPLMILVFGLTAIGIWWFLDDGGAQLLLHGAG